ncbi:Arylsulfatase [Anatilimnocola aggregata]|uniref:Arylsulfatase n=1 Tax=Anatilimnocola aggregata TaxID=2528021 RepID=A0A517YHF1_9BACT|nr:arylsulfatase [Anatilimnocola aggregata]QDU29644.1 Arylsulfatase [Anatilimnocola aggregata]
MNRFSYFFWLAAVYVATTTLNIHAAEQPNIVIIMSDDMGFSDLGCYGGEIQTPNLDSLAAGGVRFTQFYNTARCCPTRASLLTGLYPHQAGIGHMMEDLGKPGYTGNLNANCRTIAQVLQPAGYRSYAAGKWHVTRNITPDGNRSNWPLQRGFDRFYGMLSGAGSFYDPFTLCRDNRLISPFADPDYKPATYYFTDAISDHAVRFIGDHQRDHAQQPLFLYVTYTAAHWPMHALPEDIAMYKGKYDHGYAAIRQERLAKGAKLGLFDADQGLAPQAGNWEQVKNKEREIACMEVYAAMVDRMDQGIGKIIAELKRTGRFENTLIFFLQDNGGCAEPMGRNLAAGRDDGPRQDKPTRPLIAADVLPDRLVPQTRDGFPVRQGPNVIPGPADTYIGYGEGWANVSNTPFREYKHWVHEGGISTPLIAHWPQGFNAKGELRKKPAHLIDLMATCVDYSGAKYPSEATPLEGRSLRGALSGKPIEREAIYWEHEGNRAVRVGDWKLVAMHARPWELYDLSKDRTEKNDLSKIEAAKVREMSAMYDAWAARANVAPWPANPNTGNKKGGNKKGGAKKQ